MTYVQENMINIDYELWKQGYRCDYKFQKEAFEDAVNKLNSKNDPNSDDYDEVYEYTFDDWFDEAFYRHPEWFIDEAAEEEAYRKENEPKVREFFDKYFKGKTWEEIESNEELYDAWGFYSDYHKDVFGYRPHAIVCGEYVKPY